MKKTVALCSAFLLMVSAMSGCSTSNNKPVEQQPSAPTTAYDEEKTADVIVVGAGGAGLSAAIAATDNGAQNVIIIEKTNRTGGNLNLTSGSMSAAETSLQKEAGIEDTKASFVEDIMKNGAQLGNRELIETFVNEDTDMFEWMLEHGLADN